MAQISDSGFSSFSSCSYLPPPPPYKQASNNVDNASKNVSTNIFNEIANSCGENLKTKQLNVVQTSQNHKIHRSLSDPKYKSNLILKPNLEDNSSSRKASTGTISSLSVQSAFGSSHCLRRSLTNGDSNDSSKPTTPLSVLITNDGLLPNPYILPITSSQKKQPKEQKTFNFQNKNSSIEPSTNNPSIVLTRVKKENRSSSIWTSGSQISLVS